MPYRLYVDDLRNPASPDWVVVRNSAAAIRLLETRGCPVEISFDHELGGDDTAMPIVKRLIDLDLSADGLYIPVEFHFTVHSANPVSREPIRERLSRYLVFRFEQQRQDIGGDVAPLPARLPVNSAALTGCRRPGPHAAAKTTPPWSRTWVNIRKKR